LGYAVLNKDSIRRELYGCESNQGMFGEVDRLFQGRLADCMQLGLNVVIDNCNVHAHERSKVIDAARRHNYACHLILFDLPLAVAKARNTERLRRVPEQVIENFYAELHSPAGAALPGNGYPQPGEGSLMVLEPKLRGYYALVSMRA
jgi:predicted kinase